MEKLLTIAIPTYNREELLQRVLQSIYKQSGINEIEVLVSDNASEDNTRNIIKSFPNIVYIRNKENIGSDRNFLQCYRKATGKYIWLVGSDDVIIDGALREILDFLKLSSNKSSIIFLNHIFFRGKFNDEKRYSSFLNSNYQNKIINDRYQFIENAKYQLTYMSSFLLKREAFYNVNNPEKYIGTLFIHTCIAFEATKDKDCEFGIIYKPCIAQDLSPGNSGFSSSKNIIKVYEIFGKKENFVLCNVASHYGYNQRQMNKYHIKFLCENWPKTVLSMKAQNIPGWKESFIEYGYPILKHSVRAWITIIIPAAVIPQKIVALIRNIKRK